MKTTNPSISKISNLRAISATVIYQVLEQGQSLSNALADNSYKKINNDKDRALIQEISFGIMRTLPELEFYLQTLMNKPLTGKIRVLHYLLMVGIYQICYTRVPEHAAVGEAVNGVEALKKPQLKGLVNGVLRNFLRQKEELTERFNLKGNTHLHPNWLLTRIKQAYPEQWQTIVSANNQKPPMWLRVNKQHYNAIQYQTLLNESDIETVTDEKLTNALRVITPINVSKLPEFAQGVVTVQDLSAQYAAILLDPQNGETILDMCAAPGGKTTHILELAPQANVMAVDIDQDRLTRIKENLERLNQQATVIAGDGLTPEKWLDPSAQFDRILLDAPCSATGVIRRHPDIKWLRRDSDIAELALLQYQILCNIWQYLKPNGVLVYATCSILPEENNEQITKFIENHQDAQLLGDMQQYLPTENGGDGFFYAKIVKLCD